MKQLRTLISVFITATLTSCVQDDTSLPQCQNNCTIVKGYFLTDNGKVPIPNIELELSWGISGELGGSVRKISKTKTDANGFYQFQFYVKDNELTKGHFNVSYTNLDKSFLNQIYPYFGFGIFKRDTIINHNCIIPKRAYIRIEFVGSNLSNDSNYIKCFYKYKNNESYMGGLLNSKTDKLLTTETSGNQYTYFDVMRYEGTNLKEYYDSIFIKPNDTGIYKINK